MTEKFVSKEETLRNRVYEFFEENKSLGKMFTVRHFMAENVPKSTVYSILKRSEHFKPTRKEGSGETQETTQSAQKGI